MKVNLGLSLTSGQAFRWGSFSPGFTYGRPDEGGAYHGVVRGVEMALSQRGEFICCDAGAAFVSVEELGRSMPVGDFVEWYLSADVDLAPLATFARSDARLADALRRFEGLRLLRQEPFEALITFMLSPQNSVGRIARTVEALSERFGRPLAGRHAFPSPRALSRASVRELLALRLRFGRAQAENVIEAARAVERGTPDLSRLTSQSGCSARRAGEALTSLKGVGKKVADCVLLFGLSHTSAFPVDTHIARSLGDRAHENLEETYGPWGGWVQQYLYASARPPEAARER